MGMHKRTLNIGLSLGIIIFVGVAGYFILNKKTQPANNPSLVIKTNQTSNSTILTGYTPYTDLIFGISFQYPSTWINFPLLPDDGQDIVLLVPGDAPSTDIRNSIRLEYLSNSKKESLANYFSGYKKAMGGTWTEFSGGEIKGYKAVFTSPNSVTDTLISSIHFTTPNGSPIPQGSDYPVMFKN
jgi:hypothetical protein